MSEMQKIQRYIIKSAPFGELEDVLKDLEKLSPVDRSSPSISSALQQYNEQHLSILSSPQGTILLMPNNKLSPTKYLDQPNQKIYTINHIRQQITDIQDTTIELVPEVKQLIKNLSIQIQAYVDKYYKNPNASQVFADIGEHGLDLYVGFTAKNVSIGKFYTGEWISKWKINKEFIQGVVNIKAHFFQAGNVQFNQKRQLKQAFQFTADMLENSQNITKIIQKFEKEVQESLNVVYEDMPNKFFKKLRRLAPYTKTKMSWNINAVKMNQNLIGSKH